MSLSVIKTLKYILLLIIFGLSTSIGMAIAKAYGNRVDELKEFKNILNIMKTKIKFTYEPLGEIFKQIAKDNDTEIEKIFGQMANQITYYQAKDVWENCIQDADISIKQEDKNILKRLGKLLGQTDVNGQVSEIEVTEEFLSIQIEKAEEEKKKNQKMCKTLGVVSGLVFCIILFSFWIGKYFEQILQNYLPSPLVFLTKVLISIIIVFGILTFIPVFSCHILMP